MKDVRNPQQKLDDAVIRLTNLAANMGHSIRVGHDSQYRPYASVREDYERKLAKASYALEKARRALAHSDR